MSSSTPLNASADRRTVPEIHSKSPLPAEVQVGAVRVPAMIHASRDTRLGPQVLVSMRGRLSWIAAHRVVLGPGLDAIAETDRSAELRLVPTPRGNRDRIGRRVRRLP